MNEQRKWFLEVESIPGGDAMKAAWMTIKNLKYCINLLLVNKLVVEFEKIDSNLERSSSVSKMLLKSTNCLPGKFHGRRSLVGYSSRGCKESDTTERLHFHFSLFTFRFHALEKEMATHSSVLAWRIPGMGKPGGLPSLASHRVRHD